MFKVYRDNIGYRISIGDHRPAKARDLDEVKEALDHYYGGTSGHYHAGPAARTGCPFCRLIAARQGSEGRNQ